MLSFPPDWTFVAQIILFLIVWVCLRRFLFEPNLAVLKTRAQRTEGAMREAVVVKTEAQAMDEQYQTRLATSRAEARQRVDAIYKDAEDQARSVVEAARKEAEQSIANVRASLSEDIQRTRQSLEAQVGQFADEISEKLLERPLS